MPQNLITDLTVTLAAGATVSLPHGITGADGVGLAPFEVLPDRATPLVCTFADAAICTFNNPDSSAATAIFRVRRYHSISAPGSTATLRWRGNTGGGGGGGGAQQLLSAYFLDGSQAPDATVRRYDDIPTLLAAADAALPAGEGVQIVVGPGAYTWDGSALTDRNVVIVGQSVAGSPPMSGDVSLDLSGAVFAPTSPVTVQIENAMVSADPTGAGALVPGGSALTLVGCVSTSLRIALDTTAGDNTTPTLRVVGCDIAGAVLIEADTTNANAFVEILRSRMSFEGTAATASAFVRAAGTESYNIDIRDSDTSYGDNNGVGDPVLGGAGLSIRYLGASVLTLTDTVTEVFAGDACIASEGLTEISAGDGTNAQSVPFVGSFALVGIPTASLRPRLDDYGISRDTRNANLQNRFPWLQSTPTDGQNAWRGPAGAVFMAVQTASGKTGGVGLLVVTTADDGSDTVNLRSGAKYRIKGHVSCSANSGDVGAWDIDDIYDPDGAAFAPGMPGVTTVLDPGGFSVSLLPSGSAFQIEVDSGSDDATWTAYLQITRIETP